ncbi:hypothetical protein EWM64_g2603 [Hericium alpestre]|uniref:Ubiquitin-like domain-containing protein n=1 Tax=Hericium alpestre TaxID=135208 RepID=A0A4Z0A3V7_9AGAM|nr:hypothetical protein EWM64_g2603 [Hericium alpestre]
MSLVAFTFGSLGDIIALLQLADQVRRALCDTRDASAEYKDLIAELYSVVYTITNVQRVLSIQGPRRLAQSVENALYHAVGVCLHLVAQMNERISTRRQAACSRGVVKMMVADVWWSIGWKLFKREEVLFLRKRLSGQVAAMNTLLTLAQSDQLDHVGDQVSRFYGDYIDESRRQYTLIQEIHRCVTNRPHAMGYTWEAAQNPDNMPIVFTDMLGHTVTLPWEFVGTNELLHEFLVFYFRNRPYRKLVEERQYFVTNEDNQKSSKSGGYIGLGAGSICME